jgi:hypothetical protein
MSSWHHDAGLMDTFRTLNRLNRESLKMNRTGTEQIAVVLDDSSYSWLPPTTSLSAASIPGLMRDLARTGAPVGIWLLSDLDQLPERIRLVVLTNCFAAKEKEYQKIKHLLEVGGKTVLVVGAPGLVNSEAAAWNLTGPADLLGLPLVVNEAGGAGVSHLDTDNSQLSTHLTLRPRVITTGERIASFEDGPGAAAIRSLPDNGKLIWCSAPPSNKEILRQWISEAGVHLYAPIHYFVHASKELVSITGAFNQTVEIKWPEAVEVEDLFDGWQGSGATMACPFEAGQTRLFHLKNQGQPAA